MSNHEPHFNGQVYTPALDHARLLKQHERIRDLMLDGAWRTLNEIAAATGDPAASISAQLRHLRKERFGAWVVEKRPRADRLTGLYEYRLLPPTVAVVCQVNAHHADSAEHADSENTAYAGIADASKDAATD